ncbi:hypothetical protein ACLB2K_014237 [Fragaria x ananassa]
MTDQKKKCKAQWSDLPPELLSPIAESLDLIDLLGFRGVCKSWKSASSTASAQSSAKPWFLVYGENSSECQLLCESNKKYTISLPELVGATCIASSQGWLLVFQESSGSVFFFCPFSRAKIDLPNFPASQLSDHIAAFSSPPTSQDCILCVISRANNDEWELNLLRHGAEEWTKHNYSSKPYKIDAIKGAAYHKEGREFYFYDPKPHPKGLVFSTDNLNVQYYQIVRNGLGTSTLPFDYCKDYFVTENLKNKLELAENVSISTCGIQMEIGGRIICGESITADGVTDQSSSRQLKGVWIHPRFYQVSSNNQS